MFNAYTGFKTVVRAAAAGAAYLLIAAEQAEEVQRMVYESGIGNTSATDSPRTMKMRASGLSTSAGCGPFSACRMNQIGWSGVTPVNDATRATNHCPCLKEAGGEEGGGGILFGESPASPKHMLHRRPEMTLIRGDAQATVGSGGGRTVH